MGRDGERREANTSSGLGQLEGADSVLEGGGLADSGFQTEHEVRRREGGRIKGKERRKTTIEREDKIGGF